VGVAVDPSFRCGNADLAQKLDGPSAGLRIVQPGVCLDRLDQLTTDGIEWVQAGERILEDGADIAATNLAHFLIGEIVDAAAVQPDISFGYSPWWFQQPDNRSPSERFASPALADNTENLAFLDRKGNIVDSNQCFPACRELYSKVFNFQKRHQAIAVSGSGHRATSHPRD